MKRMLLSGWGLALAALGAMAEPAPPAEEGFAPTAEERAFLAEHPEIHIGVMDDFPPIHFTDGAGKPAGFGTDLLEEMNALLGGVLRIHAGRFHDHLDQAKNRGLDAVMGATPRRETGEYLAFTRPYLEIPHVIVGKRDARYYRTAQTLSGSTVGLEKGSANVDWFRENYPKVRIRLYDSTREALDGVARGETVAYVGNRAVATYLLEQEMLANLHMQGRLRDHPAALVLGVRKDWPVAAALLDRALAEVLRTKGRALQAKWFAVASHVGGAFQLKPEEQAWLEAHPAIRIGIMDDWPPMDYVDEVGRAGGIGVDFIGLLNERLEGRIEIVPGAWSAVIEDCKAGRLDAVMDITPRPDREAHFLFTKPYANIPHVIVGRKGGEYYDSFESLNGRTVAVESAFFVGPYLRDRHPRIHLAEYPATRDALAAVSSGRADAYVGSRAVATWLIARELLSNLQIQGTVRETASVNAIGVRKDLPQLHSILDAAMASFSAASVQEIYERWGGAGWSQTAELSWIDLSPQEKQWLNEHPVIRVGSNPRWAPLEFGDAIGAPRGIAYEYLERFGRALGVTFRYVPIPSWRQAQAKLREDEVELLTSLNKASARKVDIEFSTPYLSLPAAVFTREDVPYVGQVSQLEGRKVGVVLGYGMEEYLRAQAPGIRLEPVKDTPGALIMLESGELDAYAGNLLVTSHYIRQGGHARLKVGGDLDFVYQPAFAARKDMKILAQILAKALAGVGDSEKNAIANKWMKVAYEQRIDYRKLYKYAAGTLALMGVFFYWNRRMAAEIRRRKAVEASLRKSEEALVAANKELEAFSYSVSHDLRAPLRHVSGFVQLLQANAKGQLDETGVRYLEVISGAAKKMGELIDDLLSFSRTGRAQMHVEPVPLGPLVDECRRELEPETRGRDIDWRIGDLPEVAADRALLRQVLANLLGNAVKYSRKRATARIEVSARREGNEIVVCVRDNGAGFDMKYADKLFGVFQRLHTEAEFEGTGIGLANVRRIVVRHGGRTWAEGEVDQGAAFYFALPAGPPEPDKEDQP